MKNNRRGDIVKRIAIEGWHRFVSTAARRLMGLFVPRSHPAHWYIAQ
jgi:hypothetical protein